jgi:acetyltransferase EpsM
MSKLVLIGGGGFAKEVAELAVLSGHDVVGYVADTPGILKSPYLGTPDQLQSLPVQFDAVVLAFGALNAQGLIQRRAMINKIYSMGLQTLALVSPHAVVSLGVKLGVGVVVAHGVVLSVDSSVGDYCILNSCAVIGHDAEIGSNVIVAPQAFVAGNCFIADNCLLGPGSVVLEGRTVEGYCVVGTRAVVHRNLKHHSTVMPSVTKVLKTPC